MRREPIKPWGGATSPPRATLLAVHPGALGDVVLFGRLLERMSGRVTVVASGEKGRLLCGLGAAEQALDFDGLPMHEVFTESPLEQCALPARLGRYDRLLSCFAGGNERAERRLAKLCGARESAFLPTRPPADWSGHLLELWHRQLALPVRFRSRGAWPVPAEWRQTAGEELTRLRIDPGRPFLTIHPGSGGVAKCWPLERFTNLADRLPPSPGGQGAHANRQALFVIGPAERDRWDAAAVDRLRKEFAVLECPALATLAGVLACSTAYVGNDSGVTHLAAAVGTPTLALFGPSRPDHFAPLGPNTRIVRADRLALLSVQRVAEALFPLIAAGSYNPLHGQAERTGHLQRD